MALVSLLPHLASPRLSGLFSADGNLDLNLMSSTRGLGGDGKTATGRTFRWWKKLDGASPPLGPRRPTVGRVTMRDEPRFERRFLSSVLRRDGEGYGDHGGLSGFGVLPQPFFYLLPELSFEYWRRGIWP